MPISSQSEPIRLEIECSKEKQLRLNELMASNNLTSQILENSENHLKTISLKLEEETQEMQKKLLAFENEIRKLTHQNDILTAQNSNLIPKNDALASSISCLEQAKQELLKQTQDQTKKIETLTIEIGKLKMSHLIEIETKTKELQRLTENISKSSQIIGNKVPFISIHTNSLFALNQNGWKIQTQLPKQITKLQSTKFATLAVLGSTGSGKSWFANQLSSGATSISSSQLPFGWQHNPNSISLYYIRCQPGPEEAEEDGWFGILDSSGWNEPLRANKKEILDFVAHLLKENDYHNGHSSSLRNQMETYRALYDDSKLLEKLKLCYMLKTAGIIVFVISKLTQTELEKIHTVNLLLKQLSSTETAQSNSKIQKSVPQVIIVHNFDWIKRIDDVKHQIDSTLKKTFKLEEQPLFNSPEELKDEVINVNKNLFKDEFGTTHLIMAAQDSEAGKYYNPGPLKFILLKLNTLENKKALSFCESFAQFCTEELNKLIPNRSLSLQYISEDDDASRMILNDKSSTIRPKDLFYADEYNVLGHDGKFQPKYSTKVERSSDGKEARVTVELDLLDSVIEKKSLHLKDGRYYLLLSGKRKEIFSEEDVIRESEGKIELKKGSREDGSYFLQIPLLVDSEMERKKDTSIIFEEVCPGVKKFVIEFEKSEEILL